MALIVDGIAYNQERDIPEIFRQGKLRLSGPIEPGNVHSYEADGVSAIFELKKSDV